MRRGSLAAAEKLLLEPIDTVEEEARVEQWDPPP